MFELGGYLYSLFRGSVVSDSGEERSKVYSKTDIHYGAVRKSTYPNL